MMSKSRKRILAGRMKKMKKETKRILKDFVDLAEEYKEGSQEDLFMSEMITEHCYLFEDATQWFDVITKFLATGKLEKIEDEEEI